jgi:hypothetical protein
MKHVINKIKFAAMLLFQFNVEKNGKSYKKRICEERIIHVIANDPYSALESAKKIGNDEQFEYESTGKIVKFEFVGVKELIELTSLAEKDEVWSIFKEMVLPMERRESIIPSTDNLNVFKGNKYKIKI